MRRLHTANRRSRTATHVARCPGAETLPDAKDSAMRGCHLRNNFADHSRARCRSLLLFLWMAPVTFVPHFDLFALLRFKLLWPELASRTFQPAASASLVR